MSLSAIKKNQMVVNSVLTLFDVILHSHTYNLHTRTRILSSVNERLYIYDLLNVAECFKLINLCSIHVKNVVLCNIIHCSYHTLSCLRSISK